MPRALTREERERFLADVHVGVLSLNDGARGPLTSPVWYRVSEAGDIVFCTREETRKARLLEVGSRVSFLVQVEGDVAQGVLPRYVSVEGPVVKREPADLERDVRPIARRYLGESVADGYLAATRGDRAEGEVVVHVHPERWLTRDFGG